MTPKRDIDQETIAINTRMRDEMKASLEVLSAQGQVTKDELGFLLGNGWIEIETQRRTTAKGTTEASKVVLTEKALKWLEEIKTTPVSSDKVGL